MGGEYSAPAMVAPELVNRELHIAVMRNDLRRLRGALESGAQPNQPWANPAQPSVKDGRTPLNQAISLNHVEIVEALISAGADVHLVDVSKHTPLWKAAYHGRDKLIQPLVLAGAYINETNELKETPLLICAKHGFVHNNPACIKVLVVLGADLAVIDYEGRSGLHLACVHSNLSIVTVMINLSKSLDMLDYNYMTPLYTCVIQIIKVQNMRPNIPYSIFRRQIDCALCLMKNGSDPLGFTGWLRKCTCYSRHISRDPGLSDWVHDLGPESLMHITRHTIQNILAFTSINHVQQVGLIDPLPIPTHLQEYLKRRTFTMQRRSVLEKN